jgi:hypothetical protein
LGGGSRGVEPDNLIHKIVIEGPLPGETAIIRKLEPGTRTLNLSVTPGVYNITVTAYLDDGMYDAGNPYLVSDPPTVTKEARAGQSTPVQILMVFNDEGEGETPVFDNIPAFKAWLDKQLPDNDIPYDVTLNVESLEGIYDALSTNQLKRVNIDLSRSITITEIPAQTFCKVVIGQSYSGCYWLTGITLPASIESIGDYAFSICSSLTAITIPSIVKSIGEEAFGHTGLIEITIPASVRTIGNQAFAFCNNLTSVTFAEGSEIEEESFGSSAFPGGMSISSDDLKNAYIAGGAGTYIRETNGANWMKGSGYTTIDAFIAWLDEQPTNSKETSYSVKLSVNYLGSSLNSNSVGSALKANSRKYVNLDLSDSGDCIITSAFYGCTTLTGITLPKNVTTIGGSAFSICTNLTAITIPDTVKSIGERAFEECTGLTEITIPKSVTTISEYAFAFCNNLTTVTFAEGINVTSFGENAFPQGYDFEGIPKSGDRLKDFYSLVTGGAGTYIRLTNGEYWMKWNRIAYYIIAYFKQWLDAQIENTATDSVYYAKLNVGDLNGASYDDESLGYAVYINGKNYSGGSTDKFVYLDLSESTFTDIDDYAFKDLSTLTGITLPDSVTTIGDGAFYQCSSLTSITIPSSVISIGNSAFEECGNLTSVTFKGTISGDFANNAFDGDLYAKYIATGGGAGTYTREKTNNNWTKQ